ncbi:MAG: hypothetical protein WC527_08725 [Candidatus Margulisiibacteriota bacterium]
MIQDELNFDIVSNIEYELENHARKLAVFVDLLCCTDDQLFNREGLGYDLGSYIRDWLEDQADVLKEAVKKVKEKPKYIMQRAKGLIAITEYGEGRVLPADFHEITEKLEKAIKIFGKPQLPGCEDILNKLKAIATKHKNEEA